MASKFQTAIFTNLVNTFTKIEESLVISQSGENRSGNHTLSYQDPHLMPITGAPVNGLNQ